ncbi:MAG: chemotaxis protein CheW [Candidatus Riflebacteria bacterium]|nr:chemotaxis protein CheW [Candidatus Riflebacteria bacterium]
MRSREDNRKMNALPADDIREVNVASPHLEKVDSTSILVASKSLDNLVNLVGELITLQTRLNQLLPTCSDQEILAASNGIARMTDTLRDSAMSMCMMPLGPVYNRFRRFLRDLCDKIGIEIDLVIEDDGLELDKAVLELLVEPIYSIIQFLVRYDIAPQPRKATKASIRLVSGHHAGEAQICVSSTGGGLQRESITGQTVSVATEKPATDQELLRKTFLVSRHRSREEQLLSLQKFGLDAVPDEMEKLRGMLDVDGKFGTRLEFRLTFPLTLAMYQGLLVCVGERFFLLPLFRIRECIEYSCRGNETEPEKMYVNFRGAMVPLIFLRRILDVTQTRPSLENIAITVIEGEQVGLVIDRVIGELQTVIKPLGRYFREAVLFQGAAVLGDGTFALALNVDRLTTSVGPCEVSA